MSILSINQLSLVFGGIHALDGISFDIERGSITSIIGPNGAGKSSLLNCVSGFYRPTGGHIRFLQQDITGKRPFQVARLGLARTFQNIELFSGLSVLDNVMLALRRRFPVGILSSLIYWGRASRTEALCREEAEEIIDFMELQVVRDQIADSLSYGLKKRVELARALASGPSMILADEPMAGMNAIEKEDLVRFILEINRLKGVTIVLVEHDLHVVMDISSHVHVLNFGRLIASGDPKSVTKNPEVIAAYLGAPT